MKKPKESLERKEGLLYHENWARIPDKPLSVELLYDFYDTLWKINSLTKKRFGLQRVNITPENIWMILAMYLKDLYKLPRTVTDTYLNLWQTDQDFALYVPIGTLRCLTLIDFPKVHRNDF